MTLLTAIKNVFLHPLNSGKFISTAHKLLWWKWNQLVIKQPVVVTLLKDAKFICYPNSSYGSFVFYARYPEYAEMKLLELITKPKDTCLDVGANVGAVSLLLADRAHKGKVYAFEPTSDLIPLISENVCLNNYGERVTIIQKAVTDKNDSISFALANESEVNHIATQNDANTITVPAVSLDSFTSKQKISSVDILKVDVEGAEMSVFKGAKKLLKHKKIEIIVFEVNKNIEQFGSTKKELLQYLEEFGYSLYQINHQGLEVSLEKVKSNFSAAKTANLVAVANTRKARNRVSKYLRNR